MLITIGQTPIFARNSHQKIVTKDSTEEELIGISDKMADLFDLHEFLIEQGVEIEIPILYQDNQSTMQLIRVGSRDHRNKYMLVRQETIRERIQKGNLKVEYMPTEDMRANVLTKPLQGALFRKLMYYLLGGERVTENVTKKGFVLASVTTIIAGCCPYTVKTCISNFDD